jgi:RNA polymerase sigma-70 factor (ECF subfamily)
MELEQQSDEDLAALMAKAVNDQNEHAFKIYSEMIYERFERQVYKLCRYYGLRNADAEDAAQESFIKLFRSAGTYREGCRFKSWFFKIVMNNIRDKYREMKRIHLADPETLSDIPSDKGHFTLKTHSDDALEKMLSQLPEKLRETVTLRIYGELDSDSIASVTGVSDRQVRNRLEQAYDLLRKMGVEHEFQQ